MPKTKRSVKTIQFFLRLACVVWIALATRAGEVMIHLRNGDRVTGTIAGETAAEVTIQSRSLGKITIPVGEILRREEVLTNAPTPSAATNQPPVAAAPVPTVATTPKPPKRWNTELQFGLNLRYSTRDQQEALVVAKSTYGKDRFREIFDYNFTYGQTEGIQSANRMSGSAKSEYDLSPRTYVFGLAGASYDEIRQIDRQFELNPGFGYQWFKQPDFVFKTEFGLGYQDQFFRTGQEVTTYSARLAAIFTWRIFDKLIADGKAEYFQDVTMLDQYRLRFESTLRYPLLKNLSINVIVLDLYDTQAPPNVDNNDLQVRSALGIKF
jgi:putative salt-induced outer membrane protein YdiY